MRLKWLLWQTLLQQWKVQPSCLSVRKIQMNFPISCHPASLIPQQRESLEKMEHSVVCCCGMLSVKTQWQQIEVFKYSHWWFWAVNKLRMVWSTPGWLYVGRHDSGLWLWVLPHAEGSPERIHPSAGSSKPLFLVSGVWKQDRVHSQSHTSEQHMCQLCSAWWTQAEAQSWNAQQDVLPALAWGHAAECGTNNSSAITVSALTGFCKTPIAWGFAPFHSWFHGKKNSFHWIKIYVEWCLHHLVIFACSLEEKTARQCGSLIMTPPLNINIQIKKANH